MTRYRVFLVVLIVAGAASLAAQTDPTSGDGPSPNGNYSCEEICEKIDDAAGNALTNLEESGWQTDITYNPWKKNFESFLYRIEAARREECMKRRSFRPTREDWEKLIKEIEKQGANPAAFEYFRAVKAWLTLAEAWEMLLRECVKGFFQNNDFTVDIPPADIRRLLGEMTKEMRKAAREALLRDGNIPCSAENRRVILEIISTDGSLR